MPRPTRLVGDPHEVAIGDGIDAQVPREHPPPSRSGPRGRDGTGDRGVCVGGLVLGSKASTSLKLDGV